MRIIFAAVVALIASAATAWAFEARNRLLVVPLGAKDFEVIEARGEGPRGIWCAAADYVQHALNQPGGSRLYVKTARGPSVSGAGRIGVVFTTDPARLSQGPTTSYAVSVRRVGQGLPVHHAYQFCKDYLIEPDNIVFWPRRTL
tara:strand:- start:98 stop:529 length:432 start_codon:yes stop_codon:yes gene_type:complete